MTVYMIADVEVTDEEAYREYIKKAPDIIAAFGGRYLVRGGAVETIEGTGNPKRLVIEAFACALADADFGLTATHAGFLGFAQVDLFPASR